MQLLGAFCCLARAIHVLTKDLFSRQAPRPHKFQQRLLDRDLEFTGQFRGQTPAIGARPDQAAAGLTP